MSISIIYFSVSLKTGYFVLLEECFNSDFVLVMVTTHASMLCWRWVDEIRGNLYWNAFSIFVAALLLIVFGAAIAMASSKMLIAIVFVCLVLFCVVFVGEILVILFHVKAEEKSNNSITQNVDTEVKK